MNFEGGCCHRLHGCIVAAESSVFFFTTMNFDTISSEHITK